MDKRTSDKALLCRNLMPLSTVKEEELNEETSPTKVAKKP